MQLLAAVAGMRMMGAMATVVGPWDALEPLLWLGLLVSLFIAALWCLKRWHKRWWGWLLAIALVMAAVVLMQWLGAERERIANMNREVDTEFRLMTITGRLHQIRVSKHELRTADAGTLVKAMLSNVANECRSWRNDAGVLVDCWENSLRIEVGPETGDIKVSSAGQDGTFGTEDDLPREE